MTPEEDIPDRQIWSRAFDAGMTPADFGTMTTPLIRNSDTVAVVGTPLAARLLVTMRKQFPLIRVDPPHPAFADIPPESDEYSSFSANYGEVWSARALRQLIRRADRSFVPGEDRRHEGNVVVDLQRPGLRYPARTDQEFDVLTDRHLNAVRSAFRRSSRLIVALGGSEICESIADGTVLPISPGAAEFDPERHAFRTLSVAETVDDLNDAIAGLRGLNPDMAIILMISPEPIAATATPAHVVAANAHGKAVLRVAMDEVAWRPGITYFPALEIAATLANAFGADGRTLTAKAVTLIGTTLIEACEGGSIVMTAPERPEPEAAELAADTTETATSQDEATPARLTPEEKRAAGLAAHEAEFAARVAARAAAREKAAAAADAASSPPPPVDDAAPPKTVVPTVVDAYTNTVPAKHKGMRASRSPKPKQEAPPDSSLAIGSAAIEAKRAARDLKPEVESKAAQIRKVREDRRAAREAKRVSESATSSGEPMDVAPDRPATPDAATGGGRAKRRAHNQVSADGAKRSARRKAAGSAESEPAPDASKAAPNKRRGRASKSPSEKGAMTVLLDQNHADPSAAPTAESPTDPVQRHERPKQAERARRRRAAKSS